MSSTTVQSSGTRISQSGYWLGIDQVWTNAALCSYRRRAVVDRLWSEVRAGYGILANFPCQFCVIYEVLVHDRRGSKTRLTQTAGVAQGSGAIWASAPFRCLSTIAAVASSRRGGSLQPCQLMRSRNVLSVDLHLVSVFYCRPQRIHRYPSGLRHSCLMSHDHIHWHDGSAPLEVARRGWLGCGCAPHPSCVEATCAHVHFVSSCHRSLPVLVLTEGSCQCAHCRVHADGTPQRTQRFVHSRQPSSRVSRRAQGERA